MCVCVCVCVCACVAQGGLDKITCGMHNKHSIFLYTSHHGNARKFVGAQWGAVALTSYLK